MKSATIKGYRPPARWLVNGISVQPGNLVGPQVATILINDGRGIRGGNYLFTARSVDPSNLTGLQDVAGNALDGEFYSYFPSGNNHVGGDFVAQLDAVHHRVFAPTPPSGGPHRCRLRAVAASTDTSPAPAGSCRRPPRRSNYQPRERRPGTRRSGSRSAVVDSSAAVRAFYFRSRPRPVKYGAESERFMDRDMSLIFQRNRIGLDGRRGRPARSGDGSRDWKSLKTASLLAASATLDIAGGTLSYAVTGGSMNLAVSVDASDVYTIRDSSEAITLGSGASGGGLDAVGRQAHGDGAGGVVQPDRRHRRRRRVQRRCRRLLDQCRR